MVLTVSRRRRCDVAVAGLRFEFGSSQRYAISAIWVGESRRLVRGQQVCGQWNGVDVSRWIAWGPPRTGSAVRIGCIRSGVEVLRSAIGLNANASNKHVATN